MLEVCSLTRRYKGRTVVDSVSFTVRPFEIVGYVGPNGAGKSTTVKMLAGLLRPSQGQILFQGCCMEDNQIEYKMRLGYVPEETLLYTHLSGREYLQLAGRIRGMSEPALNRKIDDLLQLFGMHPYKHSAIASYSKGMKQKIMILAALLHNPEVLIFDEPLSGLDVSSIFIFRHLMKSLADQGRMIFYSSHVLEVVEKICTRILIIARGKIVADDSVEHLRDLMRLPTLEDIFAQLVLQGDTERIARDMLDVVSA